MARKFYRAINPDQCRECGRFNPQDDGLCSLCITRREQGARECPLCGEPMTDPCDPDFCEACFQDFPMKHSWIGDFYGE